MASLSEEIIGSTTLDLEADRLLAVLRADLLLLGRGHTNSQLFRENMATNLRALGEVISKGGTPDPFPHFRHGESDSKPPSGNPEIVTFLENVLSCEPLEAEDLLTNHGEDVLDRWYQSQGYSSDAGRGTDPSPRFRSPLEPAPHCALLVMWGDIEPELIPCDSPEAVVMKAREIRADDPDCDNGLYCVEYSTDGPPKIDAFAGGTFEEDEA